MMQLFESSSSFHPKRCPEAVRRRTLDSRGIANTWFSSYLSNRKQKVSLNGVSSPLLDIVCCVPQGSILGPLPFLNYIDYMNIAVKNSIVHHIADDTNLLLFGA